MSWLDWLVLAAYGCLMLGVGRVLCAAEQDGGRLPAGRAADVADRVGAVAVRHAAQHAVVSRLPGRDDLLRADDDAAAGGPAVRSS